MKIRSNHLMKDLIGAEAIHPESIPVSVPEKMLDEIKSGFKEIDGCVVTKDWSGKSIGKKGEDETGTECLLSKIHVDAFVDKKMPLKEMIRIGIAFALKLKQSLSESTVPGPFRIIVAGNNAGHTCTVRFHRLRPEQAWLANDLEGYKAEAVMSIDFGFKSGITGLKTVRQSSSFLLKLPEDISHQCDERVNSFWLDGACLLLQLSSYFRTEGVQLSASDRLVQRISKHAENWTTWEGKIYPEGSVDQASAEYLDKNGVLWIHSYLVWPHLTIYATISGPPHQCSQSKKLGDRRSEKHQTDRSVN